jgi:MFS transporter, DHA2 family, multidrug resistance protein
MTSSVENKTDLYQVNPYLIAFVVMLPTALEVLDSSIANVVLPHIAGDLGVSVDKSSWVLTCYLVSNAIILPITGWLSDTLGRKRYFLLSIFVFTLSSLLCGMSTSLNQLLLFRVLQGLGGGGLLPLSQTVLLEHFPGKKRSIGMGIYGMGVILAPIFGPMLGGWIADNHSWHWIFLINIPVGIVSILLVYIFIQEKEKVKNLIKIDYIGLAFLSLGIGALQIFLDKGENYDWFSSKVIIILAATTVISLIFVVYWELKVKNPVIDLRMLKDVNFAIATVAMFGVGMSFYAITEAIPVLLQTLMGYTAFLSGLVLAVSGTVVLVGMGLAGYLSSKLGPKYITIAGWFITIIALYLMTGFNLQADFATIAEARALMGLGTSLIFVPINAVAFTNIAKEKIEYGTGLINLMRNIGGSVGISFVNTVVARGSQVHQNYLVKNITPLNPAFNHTVKQLKAELNTTTTETYQMIYLGVQQQCGMLSYIDAFRYLMIILLVTSVLLFFLKTSKGEPTIQEI